MKHIKLYESFTEEQIRKVLSKDDIQLNVSIDEIINRLNKKQETRFGFAAIIDSEGNIISDVDKNRMTEYIIKFKELGLDTHVVEELLPDYILYNNLNIDVINYRNFEHEDDDESEDDENIESEKIWDRIESLEPRIEKFEDEIRKLSKLAKLVKVL